MDDGSWDEIEDLFAEAAAQDPIGRAALLDVRCAGRPQLRREVESLLSSHDNLGDFLRVAAPVDSSAPEARRSGEGHVGRIVGHYRLVELLASGGMGDVFRAEDLALGREAAIKLLPQSFGNELRRTVLAEAEASAMLQHPAIATHYEAGEADGESFIAMEFVRGPTLRERLRVGALPFAEAVPLACCLLEALAHAHAGGLLHRDIKPENIIVVAPTFAKLLDFGIAVPLTTRDAPSAGTIGYLAPEQAAGGAIDARTDVYQVGVVLYEMLTGRPAFGGTSRLERLAAAIAGSVDLDALNALPLPPGLSTIVRRALALEPALRYESATALLRDLRAVEGGRRGAVMPAVVAVADFENCTGDEHLSWLGSALAESIRHVLSGIRDVTVMPRHRFARETPGLPGSRELLSASLRLGCGWLVRGEVQKEDGREFDLRILVTLIDVATARRHASHEVQGPLETLFDLQRRLAAALAAELSGAAIPIAADPQRTPAIQAHEYFTRARLLIEGFGKGSLEDARDLLERAIAIDDRHAGALAALTTTYALRAIASPNAADYERAAAYADRALAVDERHVPAWVWKSYAMSALGRHAEADVAIQNALAIDPTDTEALYLAAGARLFWRSPPNLDEALALLQRAVDRDDSRGMWWLALGTAHRCLGHDREALFSFRRAQRLEGTPSRFNTAGAAAYVGEMLRRLGRLDDARLAAFGGLASAERSDHAYRDTFRAHALTVIGRVALDQQNREAAEAAFQQVLAQSRGRPRPRACGHFVVHALCGLARATGQAAFLDEARRLSERRDTYDFASFYGALDTDTSLELTLAAAALGRDA